MKVFDKLKDLFTDEVEEEELPVKKEVIQVEIPAPKTSRRHFEEIDDFEDEKDDIIIERKPAASVAPVAPKKEEISPFFDETDFEDIKRGNYTLDDVYKEEEKKPYQEEKREAYSPKKEEVKKRFQPTPIISPVYGVLDKNYKKDDIVEKSDTPRENRNITLDEVRNKAYGTLEDELENTLFGRTAILFQNNEVNNDIDDLEKDIDNTVAAIDLLRDDIEVIDAEDVKEKKKEKEEVKEEVKEEPKEESRILYEKKIIDTDEDELSLEDTIITDALKEDVPTSDKISEKDLFNLIDDMYSKGDK